MGHAPEAVQRQLVEILPRLRRFARTLTRNSHDADDLVQLAVERALSRLDQWRPDSRLDSWMFGIIRNAWIDETRAQKRRNRLFTVAEAGENVADAASEAHIHRLSVEAALERLPEEQRMVVALVLIEGYAYKEAAAVLEVPIGTVTSRLARARETLEALLGGAEGFAVSIPDESDDAGRRARPSARKSRRRSTPIPRRPPRREARALRSKVTARSTRCSTSRSRTGVKRSAARAVAARIDVDSRRAPRRAAKTGWLHAAWAGHSGPQSRPARRRRRRRPRRVMSPRPSIGTENGQLVAQAALDDAFSSLRASSHACVGADRRELPGEGRELIAFSIRQADTLSALRAAKQRVGVRVSPCRGRADATRNYQHPARDAGSARCRRGPTPTSHSTLRPKWRRRRMAGNSSRWTWPASFRAGVSSPLYDRSAAGGCRTRQPMVASVAFHSGLVVARRPACRPPPASAPTQAASNAGAVEPAPPAAERPARLGRQIPQRGLEADPGGGEHLATPASVGDGVGNSTGVEQGDSTHGRRWARAARRHV